MTLHSIRSKNAIRWLAWILSITMMSMGGVPAAFAAPICGPADLADVPLELLGGSGPPALFMIIFNNTDSMNYEIMTGGSENGQLANPTGGAPVGFVYQTNPSQPSSIEDDVFGAWKGMCYTQNKMFYNPNIDYTPWPRWEECATAAAGSIDQPSGRQPDPPDATTNGIEAHVNTPRTKPMDNAGTYDLTANFGAGFGVATYIDVIPPVTVNQETNNDTWFQMGPAALDFDGVARITVTHVVTGANNGLQTDDEFFAGPIRIVASDNLIYDVPYTDAVLTGPDGGWVEYPSLTPYGFLTNMTGTYTATWTFSGLPTNRTYKVLTKWNAYQERSDAVTYHLTKPAPVVSTINVKRRHFYLESSDGCPYLIELLDADTANFYKVDEALGLVLDKVEGHELILTAWVDLPADIRAVIDEPAVGAYTYQLQNFANWFSFFRTRGFAAKNAIAFTIHKMSYVMIGLMTVPPTNARECRWVDADFDGTIYDNSLDLMNFTYMLPDPGGNPNYADAIMNAGTYFEGGSGAIPSQSTGFINSIDIAAGFGYADVATTYPYFTQDYGGQCQQSFALMISDGGASGSSNIVNYDGNNGYPFADVHDDTMADGAMHYYENDLHPELTDDVPANYMDSADWQHMVTYGIAFGVDGQIRQNYPDCNALCDTAGCCPASWPDPWASNDPNLTAAAGLDDLYHATVNSRGIYLYASNPQDLVDQMLLIKSDIERRSGAAAAVTTNTFQRQIGATLYQGLYDSSSWFGDILAKEVDQATGAVGNTKWTATDLLDAKAWADRKIFTYAGGTAKDFSAAGGDIGLTAAMINYLSGDRTNEEPNGLLLRERVHVLGDIVHSQPFYHEGVLYVGANDGMMHAIDADNGDELFAYIPSMVHSNLHKLALNTFIDDHIYFVNASPHVKTLGGSSYLAGGLGKGGKGVYSLNVDTAKNSPAAADMFNWEYTSAGDIDMGYVYGRTYVTKTSAGPSVIFGNGYASSSGKAVLYVLNADTGAVIKKFDTSIVAGAGVVGCNGMSSPAIIDTDVDGINDLIYAGDLYGNLWKFDLSGAVGSWTISYGGNPYFTAKDDSGNVQPITCQPDVMRHCDVYRKGFIVVFGTGRYLNEDDLATNVADQVFYGLYDWENDWVRAGKPAANKFLGSFGIGGTLSNTSATLLKQEKVMDVTLGGTDFVVTTTNPITYFDPVTEIAGDHAGWYYVLPDSSERMVRNPSILAGIVFFVTNTMDAQICSGTGASFLYALDACSGSAPTKPQFDTDNDDDVDEDDATQPTNPSGQYYDTTLFDPVAGPGILYINDTFGNIIEQPIPPDPPRMQYWILHE